MRCMQCCAVRCGLQPPVADQEAAASLCPHHAGADGIDRTGVPLRRTRDPLKIGLFRTDYKVSRNFARDVLSGGRSLIQFVSVDLAKRPNTNNASRANMRPILIALVMALASPCLSPAESAPITFTFQGTMTGASSGVSPAIRAGDIISGNYTFEANTPDGETRVGFANYPGAITNLVFAVGGYEFSSALGQIRLENNFGGRDLYAIVTQDIVGPLIQGYDLWHFEFSMVDTTQTALVSEFLDTIPPRLESFGDLSVSLGFISPLGAGASAYGRLTNLTVLVPEPAPIFLFFWALLSCLLLGSELILKVPSIMAKRLQLHECAHA
jgi:hypothetical protein